MDLIFVRLLFIVVVAVTCFVIEPFGLARNFDAGVGALIGAAIVVFEWKLRTVSLKRLIGAAIGSILGICGAYLFALVIRNSVPAESHPELSADTGHAADGLCWPDHWGQQGRSAEPGGAGRSFRRREDRARKATRFSTPA